MSSARYGHAHRWLVLTIATLLIQSVDADTCSSDDLDAERLSAATRWLTTAETHLDSVLIEHCGEIVVEVHRNGHDRLTPHDLQSATKTITGLLVGIAQDHGFVHSLDQPIVELLPGSRAQLPGDKRLITVRHLLEMTSGLKWIDFGPERSFTKQAAAPDSAAFIIGEPLVSTPGETWFYNTGSSHLLSAIVRETTGRSTKTFADDVLFGPLGFGDYEWRHHADGVHEGGWQLYLRPVDMLKIGRLLIEGGVWQEHRIVSQAFIDAATSFRQPTTFGASGYGFQMWVETDYGPTDLAGARGWGGQNILVAQDLDMVIVTTGSIDHPAETANAVRRLISEFITPAHPSKAPG